MTIAYPTPIPYIMLLVFCLVIFFICFSLFSSLRAYRKKRNLLIYSVFGFILILIGYQAYDVSLGPAFARYSLDNNANQFYPGQVNQLNISCSSLSRRSISFYLVLKSSNASLMVDSQQNYLQVNSTTIKIPFTFHGLATENKTVLFTIDEDVSSFEFYPHVEGKVPCTSSTSKAQGVLNPATNSYTMHYTPGPAV